MSAIPEPARRRGRRSAAIAAVVLAGTLDLIANYLAAHVFVPIGPFLIPGGTFLFAISFTVYDYLRRVHGLPPTLAAIALGFLASIAYNAIWGGGVGRIAVAGLIALVFSSSSDLGMQSITIRRPIWQYVSASNAVSLLIDSIVFTLIAFAALPFSTRLQIMTGQYLAKLAMTVVTIPLVYWARSWTAPSPSRAPQQVTSGD